MFMENKKSSITTANELLTAEKDSLEALVKVKLPLNPGATAAERKKLIFPI